MKACQTSWRDEWHDLPECMQRFATRFGPTHDHVLLLGPPGSGKGYLARILHELSPRAGGPFVPHNCGVFTESLAEAQLFGHVKGAYTGAAESKLGMVETAAGGTLFLDEFGALPHAIQAMFLIFLETGEFSRLGSTVVRKADLRVIAATNRDLGMAIARGEFREDLVARIPFYYAVPPQEFIMTRTITTILSVTLACLATFINPGSALAGPVAPDRATAALSGTSSGSAPIPTVNSVSVPMPASGFCDTLPPLMQLLCNLFLEQHSGDPIDWESVFRHCTNAGNEVYFWTDGEGAVIYKCTKPK